MTQTLEIPLIIEAILVAEDYPSLQVEAQIWRFHLSPGNNCETCLNLNGFDLQIMDSDELFNYFPEGEFQDFFTFIPHVHPNCNCEVDREDENVSIGV